MKICNKCDKQYDDSVMFCGSCGIELTSISDANLNIGDNNAISAKKIVTGGEQNIGNYNVYNQISQDKSPSMEIIVKIISVDAACHIYKDKEKIDTIQQGAMAKVTLHNKGSHVFDFVNVSDPTECIEHIYNATSDGVAEILYVNLSEYIVETAAERSENLRLARIKRKQDAEQKVMLEAEAARQEQLKREQEARETQLRAQREAEESRRKQAAEEATRQEKLRQEKEEREKQLRLQKEAEESRRKQAAEEAARQEKLRQEKEESEKTAKCTDIERKALTITRVASKSYGTGVGDKVLNMIFKHDELPIERRMSFYTVADNQGAICIDLYENDSLDKLVALSESKEVFKKSITIKKAIPKGTNLELVLNMDINGLITIYLEYLQIREKVYPLN